MCRGCLITGNNDDDDDDNDNTTNTNIYSKGALNSDVKWCDIKIVLILKINSITFILKFKNTVGD